MRLYYRAVTQDGKTIRGLVEAKDVKEAANYLRKHQFIPIQILPENKVGIKQYFPFLKKISGADLVFFTRQLSSMILSGLTLIQALNVLKNQTTNDALGEMIDGVISDIEDGAMLSKALEKYPTVFSPIYIALIRTAESSGLLDKVLARLADNLEKREKLIRTIRGALLYPIIVVVMMILVMIVMMIFVIPQLTTLYGELDLKLPPTTIFVVGISNFFIDYWYIALTIGAIIFYYARKWYSKPEGKRVVDIYTLKIPIFGKLFSDSMMAEFSRTLSLLISSGSLVVDSLLKSGDVVSNTLYRDAISLVAKRVEKGISMGDAMEASPFFPPIIVEMVKIGEQTGKLDASLLKASEYFEREVEDKVKVMSTLLEPVIMVLLAIGVGFLIISIITPIYNLISNIS
ncbi:MAG TPA: type II secretion system F family protein [Candidatus Saccharimonadales bacterium]|nr:type II secretion system F family protein [Candidatus Saccharimonadales bacterium]